MRTSIAIILGFLLTACDATPPPDSGGTPVVLPAADKVMCAALGIDYKNNVGTLAVLGLPSQTLVKEVAPGAVSGDTVVRAAGGKFLVVNRYKNNVTIVVPTGTTGQRWVVERQFSTGPSSNPQDVAVWNGRAYVVLYNRPVIDIYDLADPRSPVGSIGLGSFDPDGNPNAQSIAVVGSRAFVAMDLLDTSFTARGNGRIAILDLGPDVVDGSIELTYANPYNFMVPQGGDLLIATEGDFSGTLGGIERIGDAAGTPAVKPCVVKASDAGGNIGLFAATSAGDVFFVTATYDADWHPTATLRRASTAGIIQAKAVSPPDQTPSDVLYVPETDQIVYGDMKAGGLRIYDVQTNTEVTTAAIDLGLPPGAANGIACMPRM